MPLPTALSDRADSDIADLDVQLITGGKQASILASEGRYLQMVGGMAATPADEASENVDDTAKPSDRDTSPFDNSITRQTNSTICTEIHEYDGPNGPGWGYYQEVMSGGNLWYRFVWKVNPTGFPAVAWTEET